MGEKTADEVGFDVGNIAQGELELTLRINERSGRCWLSREMWEAIGEAAGWLARLQPEEGDRG